MFSDERGCAALQMGRRGSHGTYTGLFFCVDVEFVSKVNKPRCYH